MKGCGHENADAVETQNQGQPVAGSPRNIAAMEGRGGARNPAVAFVATGGWAQNSLYGACPADGRFLRHNHRGSVSRKSGEVSKMPAFIAVFFLLGVPFDPAWLPVPMHTLSTDTACSEGASFNQTHYKTYAECMPYNPGPDATCFLDTEDNTWWGKPYHQCSPSKQKRLPKPKPGELKR